MRQWWHQASVPPSRTASNKTRSCCCSAAAPQRRAAAPVRGMSQHHRLAESPLTIQGTATAPPRSRVAPADHPRRTSAPLLARTRRANQTLPPSARAKCLPRNCSAHCPLRAAVPRCGFGSQRPCSAATGCVRGRRPAQNPPDWSAGCGSPTPGTKATASGSVGWCHAASTSDRSTRSEESAAERSAAAVRRRTPRGRQRQRTCWPRLWTLRGAGPHKARATCPRQTACWPRSLRPTARTEPGSLHAGPCAARPGPGRTLAGTTHSDGPSHSDRPVSSGAQSSLHAQRKSAPQPKQGPAAAATPATASPTRARPRAVCCADAAPRLLIAPPELARHRRWLALPVQRRSQGFGWRSSASCRWHGEACRSHLAPHPPWIRVVPVDPAPTRVDAVPVRRTPP